MKMILPVLLLSIAAHDMCANLGETFDQTVARYGPVLKKEQSANPQYLTPSEATVQYEFEKNGFRIRVSFVNGKCGLPRPGHHHQGLAGCDFGSERSVISRTRY